MTHHYFNALAPFHLPNLNSIALAMLSAPEKPGPRPAQEEPAEAPPEPDPEAPAEP